MEFTKAKIRDIDGTHLVGNVVTNRCELEAVFGPPGRRPGDKITTEWLLKFADGTVATIYDYKHGRAPRIDEDYDWHVGGHSDAALERVEETLWGAGK